MTPEIERLFHELADLPADEREARLQDATAPAEVKQQVRDLLACDRGGSASPTLQGMVRDEARIAVAAASEIGDMAGPYRLVKELGRGGMGAVFLGERDDGAVKQAAAVKLIGAQAAFLPGMVERFVRERNIQASLSHPNIARLFDAGVTSRSTPYFAMEYCDGEPIDAYCRRLQLSPAEVVKLLLPVCEAVSHAHRHMIVHRDLKPSNIFIDKEGNPKLLDFGIAKVLESGGGAPAADATRTIAPMLTLHYASPEQVRGEPTGTSSDVYSIGAVLYRLLTGHFAHETANDLELPRLIAETDPARPSVWNPALSGDLENILLMALRREAARRYPSVEALADDLRLFLDRRPVRATPPSLAYRARRFVQRNPAATAASLLAAASLLGGTAFSIHQARQARQRLDDVRHMANVFLFDFEKSIRHLPGALPARRKVIETAQGYLEKIAPQAGNDPALMREVADAYRNLADVQWIDGSPNRLRATLASLDRSHDLRRQLGDHNSTDPRRLLPYIEGAATMAQRLSQEGQQKRGRELSDESLRLAESWMDREPVSHEALRALQVALYRRGWVLESDGEPAASARVYRQSYEAAVKLTTLEPANTEALSRLADTAGGLANILSMLDRNNEAVEPARAAVEAAGKLVAADPVNVAWRRLLINSLNTLGTTHKDLADDGHPVPHLDLASRNLDQAFAESKEAVRRDPVSVPRKTAS